MTEEIEKKLSKPYSKAGRLQRHCLNLLAERRRDGAIPTSGRFLFYELVSRGVVPKDHYRDENGNKKSRTPAQDVADALWYLRKKAPIVPMDWIVDETRDLDSWQYAPSVYKYARRVWSRPRRRTAASDLRVSFPAVETEALRQREIQRILTERLDAELPEPLLAL
jgi:hypothetical protein